MKQRHQYFKKLNTIHVGSANINLPSHVNAVARRDAIIANDIALRNAIIAHDVAYHNYQNCLIALRNAYDGNDENATSVATANLISADKQLMDADMNLLYAEELCNPTKPQSWPRDYGTFN